MIGSGDRSPDAPLIGLRVLELGAGVACPYAGRLFAMLGADVWKVEPPGGDPTRRHPVDTLPVPEDDVGPLFVHLNAGKALVPADSVDLEQAVAWADVVLDDRVRSQVSGGLFDPSALRQRQRAPVVARVTAWGFDADEPGRLTDELVVQAASGALAVPTAQYGEPVRFPGWQSQYLAGGYAFDAALVALGAGAHEVEITWIDAMLTAVEAGLAGHLHGASQVLTEGVEPPPQRAIQDGAFPSGPFRCADGFVVPGTVRPADWKIQCRLYGREDLLDDERFGWRDRWTNRDALRAEIQPWYEARTRSEIFRTALDAGWAAAMVVTGRDALDDPHLAERGFLSRVVGRDGSVAGRPWRDHHLAEGAPVVLDLDATGDRSPDPAPRRDAAAVPRPPSLEGLRVLELTWAWAGPFVGRFLGAFGADVAHVETGRRPDGWRTPLRWKRTGLPLPDGVDPDDRTFDAAALFNSVNRSKRSVSIDLTTAGGHQAFGRLLDVADVFVVNMSAGVLADQGIEDAVHAAVGRGLVAVTLPAAGASGPYRGMPGYGTLTEGLGGFGARFGPAADGAGISTTYYPDCVAGVHATAAVLAGLARRQVTGEGSFVDLSQQETMWLQLGEDLVVAAEQGRDTERLGNSEPGTAASGIFRTADDRWLAVAATESLPPADEDLAGWVARHRLDDAVAALGSVGAAVAPVVDFDTGFGSGAFADRGVIEDVDHPVTGRRTYLAVPVTLDGTPTRSRRPAPRFAEHTDEVLAEWAGAGVDDLDRWRRDEAVGTVPAAHTPGGPVTAPSRSRTRR